MLDTTLIALGGQTASGKSELAIRLANALGDCWIIGCDSRQIYKYLNLGTGKIEGSWEAVIYQNQLLHTFLYEQIPHFFIDYIDPAKRYTLTDFLIDFRDFVASQKLPKYIILCGGTGLYIKAILERYQLDAIKPEHIKDYEDAKAQLQTHSLTDLQNKYSELSTQTSLNQSDFHNPRRLANHILNHHSKANSWGESIVLPQFQKTINLAIRHDQENLYKKISDRILSRIKNGMIEEVQALSYLGTERLIELGLEYRHTHLYLLGQFSYDEYIQKLTQSSINYAQRQLTWLNRQNVNWVNTFEDALSAIR